MTNPSIFNQVLFWPILNVLIAFYKGLTQLGIPGAFGFSIIAATALIRLILYPLTSAQIKSAQKMTALKPQLDQLSKLHKNDKQRLQQEQMRLYKEAGINPAAGCLPVLLQMPILIALYQVFFRVLNQGNLEQVVGEINKIVYFPALHIQRLDLSFFGLNLAGKPSDWTRVGWWLLLIPVITALLQFWQTKIMMPAANSTNSKQLIPASGSKAVGDKKDDKKEDDMSAVMQKQMSVMMPLMIGFFAYSFPLGLSFYWNTFTIFGIIQQYQLNSKTHDSKKI